MSCTTPDFFSTSIPKKVNTIYTSMSRISYNCVIGSPLAKFRWRMIMLRSVTHIFCNNPLKRRVPRTLMEALEIDDLIITVTWTNFVDSPAMHCRLLPFKRCGGERKEFYQLIGHHFCMLCVHTCVGCHGSNVRAICCIIMTTRLHYCGWHCS